MSTFLDALTALTILGLAWWFLSRLLRPQAPAEPAEDPFSSVPVPLGMPPKGRSSAVALAEPGDDDTADAFPPRER